MIVLSNVEFALDRCFVLNSVLMVTDSKAVKEMTYFLVREGHSVLDFIEFFVHVCEDFVESCFAVLFDFEESFACQGILSPVYP